MKHWTYILCALPFVTGCTLITQLEPTKCRSHRTCDVLNTLGEGDIDACHRWQCSGNVVVEEFVSSADPLDVLLSAGTCVLQAQDLDNDGFVGDACESSGEGELDCADLNAATNPGADETCDGRDNNCDGVIDEGVLPLSPENPVVLDAQGVAFAHRTEAGVAYATANGGQVLRFDSVAWDPMPLTVVTQAPPGADEPISVNFLGATTSSGCWKWRDPIRVAMDCQARGPVRCEVDPDVECACSVDAENVMVSCAKSSGVCVPYSRRTCRANRAWSTALGTRELFVFEGMDGILQAGLRGGDEIELLGPTRRSSLFGGINLSFENMYDGGDVGDLELVSGETGALLAWRAPATGTCSATPVTAVSMVLASSGRQSWVTAPNGGLGSELPFQALSLASVLVGDTFVLALGTAESIRLYEFQQGRAFLTDEAAWRADPHSQAAVPPVPVPSLIAEIPITDATDIALAKGPSNTLRLVARTGCEVASSAIWTTMIRNGVADAPGRLADGRSVSELDVLYNQHTAQWIAAWFETLQGRARLRVFRLDSTGVAFESGGDLLSIGTPILYLANETVRLSAQAGTEIIDVQITCTRNDR